MPKFAINTIHSCAVLLLLLILLPLLVPHVSQRVMGIMIWKIQYQLPIGIYTYN